MPDALVFPEHFPPKTRWKKFFIGVRWLGPDLSFFKDLKAQQGARRPEMMDAWGGGLRHELAEFIARELSRGLRWKTAVFLPQDSLALAINGPRFGALDSDFVFEDILVQLGKARGIALPRDYWANRSDMSFGDFVDDLVEISRTHAQT
jgi:hypothetical protein